MSTLYLHIGTPKTGTTAIQLFLNKNWKALEKQDCCYPRFPYVFNGVRTERNGHFLSTIVKNKELIDDCYTQIYRLAEKFSSLVLTDEILWNFGLNSEENCQTLKNNLDSHNIDLKVIVYLRRQDTYCASLWAQKIKGVKAETYDFHTYLEQEANEKNHLNYYGYLKNLSQIIGKESIIVRPYEFSQFKQNNIIADFLDIIGIKYNNSFSFNDTKKNISIQGNVLEVKRYLNMVPEFKGHSSAFRVQLESVQNQLKEKGLFRNKSTFLKNERKAFMDKFNEGNSAIAREFLGRDDRVLFTDPLPSDDPKKKDYSQKELLMILDMLRAENQKMLGTPLPDEKFEPIYNKAKELIIKENKTVFQKIFSH